MLTWLELAEERVDAARRDALAAEKHALEMVEIEEMEEPMQLRRRLAAAIILLAAKLDPRAIDAIKEKAA